MGSRSWRGSEQETSAGRERGAATQAILMSVYRTLKLRGHHSIDVITEALRTCVTTGRLPTLPGQAVADG